MAKTAAKAKRVQVAAAKAKRPAPKAKAKTQAKRAPVKRAPVKAAKPRVSARAKVARRPRHLELDEGVPRDEVLEIFRSYDRDGSGSIDRGELAGLLEALGMSPTEDDVQIALDVVDANRSGKISWPEFSRWWRAR